MLSSRLMGIPLGVRVAMRHVLANGLLGALLPVANVLKLLRKRTSLGLGRLGFQKRSLDNHEDLKLAMNLRPNVARLGKLKLADLVVPRMQLHL
jgi:hypothetical protein